MKHFITLVLLLTSTAAPAKGLWLATSHDSMEAGGIFYPPPERTRGVPHVWTKENWHGKRRGSGVTWIAKATHLLPKEDPRLKEISGRMVGFCTEASGDSLKFCPYMTFDTLAVVTSGLVQILSDESVLHEIAIEVNEAEFVHEPPARSSRLELSETDQKNIRALIITATKLMTSDQLEKVTLKLSFNAKDKNTTHVMEFNLEQFQAALGLSSKPERAATDSPCERVISSSNN